MVMTALRLGAAAYAAALAGAGLASAGSTLFTGGTIIAYDTSTESVEVIREGSVLVTDDRIVSVSSSPGPSNVTLSARTNSTLSPDTNSTLSPDYEVVDITGKILTPGFVDTHRHGWQTALKTMASNTTLVEYFFRYSEFQSGAYFTADDVYLGQLVGLYEALNAGVTTTLDHAHHTWSNATAEAGLQASIDSGARVFWAYGFHNVPNVGLTIADQIPHFRAVAEARPFDGSPTELGVAYDGWSSASSDRDAVLGVIRDYNVSVVTTHSLGGVWGRGNMPINIPIEDLNGTTPFVFSHASFITPADAMLLRSTNQFISITPESEMHYGHGHPHSHSNLDQAALGVDTHFTFSTDILTQARLWMQATRRRLYKAVTDAWMISPTNPFSVVQAFKLATRSGGLALRRDDIGVIAEGAKADLVVWDGDSPAMLGWVDPVAAVMLHASVGDITHVMVDGKFVKKNGKLTVPKYNKAKKDFLTSARRIQETYAAIPLPHPQGQFFSGYPYSDAVQVDVQRGEGTGYGDIYIQQ